jgi:hypothetical protein
MSFFGSILSSVVKVALTPVAVVKDVVNVATGQEADATKKNLEDAVDDLEDAMDDITGG